MVAMLRHGEAWREEPRAAAEPATPTEQRPKPAA
jgi:hypothetical protein